MVTAVDAVLEALNENNRALARLTRLLSPKRCAWRLRSKGCASELRSLASEAQRAEGHPHPLGRVAAGVGEEALDQRGPVPAQRGGPGGRLPAPRLADGGELPGLLTTSQHTDFTLALERAGAEIQKRLWADLDKDPAGLRAAHSRRTAAGPAARGLGAARGRSPRPRPPRPSPRSTALWFAERFRGTAGVRAREAALLCALLPGLRAGAGSGLRARRVSGADAGGRRRGARHRPERRVRRPVPLQGPGGRESRSVRLSRRPRRLPRWTASSPRRWWSTCRRSACRS